MPAIARMPSRSTFRVPRGLVGVIKPDVGISPDMESGAAGAPPPPFRPGPRPGRGGRPAAGTAGRTPPARHVLRVIRAEHRRQPGDVRVVRLEDLRDEGGSAWRAPMSPGSWCGSATGER